MVSALRIHSYATNSHCYQLIRLWASISSPLLGDRLRTIIMASAEPQSRRAAFVGERLAVLQRLSSESVELLDVMDSTLADLSTLTAPIHSRATALTAAQRNIAVAVAALDELMQHLATPRRVRNTRTSHFQCVCACEYSTLMYLRR